ncbi:MAG: methylglyoxal synthase [Fusobacteriaceae bacterium]
MKKVAIIAHDNMKNTMINFVKSNLEFFKKQNIIATGTTGKLVSEATGLTIHRCLSGPLGGDQQIGAEIAMENIEAIFFLRDPMMAQPHEPDITALIRLADVHKIPIATNISTAELLIDALSSR